MDVTNEQLEMVSNLAEQQKNAEMEVERHEEELKTAKERLRRIQEDLLPTAMREVGLESFKLKTGESVDIKTGITASISKKNEPVAFQWLTQHGHEDLIKNEVKANFSPGEDEKAERVIQTLEESGISFNRKRSVHAGTLKAFCKEQIEKGVNIPFDLFGIFEWQKSIIK